MQFASEKILILGDRDDHVLAAVAAARPDASIVRAASIFDGLAELHAGPFSAVVAAVEPMERRPEPAVRALRQLVGNKARVFLYGNTTLEPLSRKMLNHGVDDYFVTPADAGEIREIFDSAPSEPRDAPTPAPADRAADALVTNQSPDGMIDADALLQVALDALLDHPQASANQLAKQLTTRLPLGSNIRWVMPNAKAAPSPLAIPIRNAAGMAGHLDIEGESDIHRALLGRLAPVFTKVAMIEERHALMQKLAITDDLTGLYNCRYFNHFLRGILEKAKARRFAVTLLLFDIDNFKRYNDTFGHGVGDEILRQTASLMRRCCRDHDHVARIGGDEFAVVFWEKDAPRVPYDQQTAHGRVPSTPMIIAQRFRKLLGSSEFSALGPAGKGVLTISGGMAVYPFDGQSPAELIKAADEAQMFGAKKSGKNSIALVGEGGTIFAGE